MANRGTTFDLKLRVNNKDVPNTLKELNKEFYKSRAAVNKLTEGTEEWIEANQRLAIVEQKRKEQIENQRLYRKELLKTIDAEKDNADAISEFGENFSKAFQGIRNGDLIQAREGLNGIKQGIVGATKAGLAFIATPMGAAIAVLAGIALATKKWFDYNTAAVEALKTTKQITGLSDQAADQARINAEILTETFGGDFKTNLEAARNLVQQFGISYDQAFDIISDNLVRGQKNNDEFFDSLREYPTFFAQAKFSAEEFANVIAAGYDLGIYNDKLPDALKEADLSLREQTESTRDALVNAFGAPFTDSILSRVKRGEISTKEALQEISEEADKSNINIQQNAQLTADLFRGAGEDAGGALKVFEALNVALNDQKKPLTESEQLLQDQINATEELKEVSSALFFTGDKGFGLLIDKAKLFGTRILVDILRTGVDLINWFIDLNNESRVFSGIISIIGKLATVQFEIIGTLLDNAKKGFSGLGDVISGAFTFDQDRIKLGFAKMADAGISTFEDLKRKGKEAAADVADAFAGKTKFERITLDSYVSDDSNPPPQSPAGNLQDDRPSEDIDKEAQKRADKEKAIREKVREQLKEWEQEREIEDQLEKFEKDKRDEEREILELKNKFAKLVEQAQGEKELLSGLEEEKLAQIQDIRDKYAEERLKKAKKEADEIQKKDEELKQRQIEAENELARAKWDAAQIGIQALQSLFDESTAIYKVLFAADKIVAMGDVILNGIKERAAISAAWSWNPAIATPLLLASKIRTGTSLATIAATTIQGFFTGGDTGNSYAGFRDRDGRKVAGLVHQGEYVIPKVVRQDPEMPVIENYIENKRRKKLGLYQDGGPVDSQSPNFSVPGNSPMNDPAIAQAIWALIEKLSNPMEAQVFFGFEAEERRAEMQRKLEKIKNRSKIS